MSIVTFVAITFGVIGLSFGAMSFWALMSSRVSCKQINTRGCGHNVCIRVKDHKGLHMSYDGKEF